MMKNCIRILYYAEHAGDVKSLETGLDIVGTAHETHLLGDSVSLTEKELGCDSMVTVLFTSHHHLNQTDVSTFEPRVHASSDYPIYIAVVSGKGSVQPFVQERFIVLQTDSPEQIRREVMQYYKRQLYFEKGYRSFVGRNKELDQFQNILYSGKSSSCKAVFISGRTGTGRNAFARECIRQTSSTDAEYEPYCMALGEKDNIENFIVLLRQMSGGGSNQDFLNHLGGTTEDKSTFAITLLSSILGPRDFLIIYDDGACMQRNGKVSDWFLSILNHPAFKPSFRLFVLSTVLSPWNNMRVDEPYVTINLYGMSLPDRKKLIYRYSSNFTTLDEEEVDYLARELSYSPSQIIMALDEIKRKGTVKPIINDIETFRRMGDGKVLSLIKRWENDDPQHDIFVFMARLEYSSKTILEKVFGSDDNDVKATITQLDKEGCLERFCDNGTFYHIDGYICNYIRRNRIAYRDSSLESHIREVLDQDLASSDILKDYPDYLYKAKTSIKNNPASLGPIDRILPSVVLGAIIEKYDHKDWKDVINIAERILEENPPYFPEVIRAIRYWYCLALAREREKQKFDAQIELFKNDIDYHFLKGFFFRMNGAFVEAEKEFRTVLKSNPHMQRARRELVIVLVAMHKFGEALDLAASNYENDPENPYHVNAYFRCLLRKNGRNRDDDQLLYDLLTMAKQNPAFGDAYKEGMQFEYDRFVLKWKTDELYERVRALRGRYGDKGYIGAITNDYMSFQDMEPRKKPIAYDSETE